MKRRPLDVPVFSIIDTLSMGPCVVLRVKAYKSEVCFTVWPIKLDSERQQTEFIFRPYADEVEIIGAMTQSMLPEVCNAPLA